jgi:MFS family permease
MLAAIAVVLLFIKEPELPPEQKNVEAKHGFLHNLVEVLKASDRSGLMILLAILCWFLGYNALETWISSFGKFELGIDEGRMSIMTASMALTFVIFAVPSGFLATRFGRKRVIMIGIGGMVVLTLYGLLISNLVMLLLLLIPAGIFWALINVNSLPMVYDVGGDARIGAFTGMYYLAANLAAVGGPQAVGVLIDLTQENYRIMFLFAAVFMILAGLFMSRVKDSGATVGG